MLIKAFIAERTFRLTLLEVFTVFLLQCHQILLDEFVFLFFCVHPQRTGTHEIRCYPTLRAGAETTAKKKWKAVCKIVRFALTTYRMILLSNCFDWRHFRMHWRQKIWLQFGRIPKRFSLPDFSIITSKHTPHVLSFERAIANDSSMAVSCWRIHFYRGNNEKWMRVNESLSFNCVRGVWIC